MQPKLVRPNLNDELAQSVRRMILDGSLAPGRVNEVHLAAALGVSRTPLREALMRLVSEGALTSIARRGFFVAALSVEEVEQLYPIRAILDPAALRLAGIPPPARLKRLKDINRRFAAAASPEQAVRLDDQWHFELLADANPILLGFIQQAIWRTRRYELAFMKGKPNVTKAVDEHEEIIAALEKGDLDRACAALTRNMSSAKEPILQYLRQREQLNG
jgi:DNA-binding GntR family transcriptional regulator